MPTPVDRPEQRETLAWLRQHRFDQNWPTSRLSDDIHRVTGTRLSVSTLDRIQQNQQCLPRTFHHIQKYRAALAAQETARA